MNFTKLAASFVLVASTVAVFAQDYPHAQQPWTHIATPPLRGFHPAKPTRIQLPNGVQIFLEEDHELPFISGFIRVRGGARDEPADKLGLVSLYGQAWRTSGTSSTPGDQLDDQLALKAASIETGGGQASTYVTWNSFTKDFDSTFASAIDLLLHPKFQEQKVELAKRSMMTSILRRNDDAASIAAREAVEIAYGRTNPYGREAQLATVSSITLDDLDAWHKRTVVGSNLIVGLVGDFDSKEVEAKLKAAFEPIPRGEKLPAPVVTFSAPKPGVYFAAKSDVDQSNIYLVGLGTEQSNPDYYALTVMNEIFSGGFASRVVQNVRTRLGLAYDVGGSFGAAYDHPGLFAINAGTRSNKTVAATQAILDEVRKLRTEPPTEAELRRAKDDLLNSFVFRYDDTEKILGEQVTLAVYDYPADFLERYRTGVEKVTVADIERVAQKYVQPEKLATVVVGNPAEIDPPLTNLGPVTKLDIAIPGAPKE
ncbi:MAG: pitrilysin family protein [Acidobacteriaceae bacterium]|nr:pitrilysin family protein [Acidobacteriaceae bacterium]